MALLGLAEGEIVVVVSHRDTDPHTTAARSGLDPFLQTRTTHTRQILPDLQNQERPSRHAYGSQEPNCVFPALNVKKVHSHHSLLSIILFCNNILIRTTISNLTLHKHFMLINPHYRLV